MLADVTPYLRCPLCHGDLALAGAVLGCGHGHRFDVARQGYASLLPGDARTRTADTAAMVTARAEFLACGAYAPLTAALSEAVGRSGPGCVVDAGGGTGHHLAGVLERHADRLGIACDLSRYAARRAARAHPRIGAVVADVWRGLPVRDGSAQAVLDVFAPRNPAEFHRVLHDDGLLVVATPLPEHLTELVHRLGMLSVDADKPRRLRDALDPLFAQQDGHDLRWRMELSRRDVRALVEMGPSAWHSDDVVARLRTVPEPVEVTAAVTVATYRPCRD
ncbi:MAG TPA: hypothetical protein VHG70_02160 [Nocardioidaceae bacterium]|nr:hypothetical protein [Nocardioidaceae bacterium]